MLLDARSFAALRMTFRQESLSRPDSGGAFPFLHEFVAIPRRPRFRSCAAQRPPQRGGNHIARGCRAAATPGVDRVQAFKPLRGWLWGQTASHPGWPLARRPRAERLRPLWGRLVRPDILPNARKWEWLRIRCAARRSTDIVRMGQILWQQTACEIGPHPIVPNS